MNNADIKRMAKRTALELKEKQYPVLKKIQDIIRIAGDEFVRTTLEETHRIEENGGLMTNDNSRRRTHGGVFFHLVKQTITPELRDQIFPPKNWAKRKAKKKESKEKSKQSVAEPENDLINETDSPVTTQVADPESLPAQDDATAQKLAKLEDAAKTLRERLAEMEATGQKGVKMTQTLLTNTEKQIDTLLKAKSE